MQGPASPTGISESWEHPPCHSNSFSAREGRGSTCAAPNLPTAGALHTRLLLLLQHPSRGAGKQELLLAQPGTRSPGHGTAVPTPRAQGTLAWPSLDGPCAQVMLGGLGACVPWWGSEDAPGEPIPWQGLAEDQGRAVLPGPAWCSWAEFYRPAATREPSPEHGLMGEAGGWRGQEQGLHAVCAELQPRAGQGWQHAQRPAHGITSAAGGQSCPRSGTFGGVKKERNSGSAFLLLQASETQCQPEPGFTPREDTDRTVRHTEMEAGWIFAVTLSS